MNKTTITGIGSLIKKGIKYNKETVVIPRSNWELIETILEKIKIEIPNVNDDKMFGGECAICHQDIIAGRHDGHKAKRSN